MNDRGHSGEENRADYSKPSDGVSRWGYERSLERALLRKQRVREERRQIREERRQIHQDLARMARLPQLPFVGDYDVELRERFATDPELQLPPWYRPLKRLTVVWRRRALVSHYALMAKERLLAPRLLDGPVGDHSGGVDWNVIRGYDIGPGPDPYEK